MLKENFSDNEGCLFVSSLLNNEYILDEISEFVTRKFLKHIRTNFSFEIKGDNTIAVEGIVVNTAANPKYDIESSNTIESNNTAANTKIDIATNTSINNRFNELITNQTVKKISLFNQIVALQDNDLKICGKADVRRHA
jgi:hypothetical protein